MEKKKFPSSVPDICFLTAFMKRPVSMYPDDIGIVYRNDAGEYFRIADRITNVIRSGAGMVPTVLLENLTANADYVLEATYVGVPDEKWGERPMALIKLGPGAQAKKIDDK